MINKISTLFGLDADYFVKGGFWLSFAAFFSAIGGLIISTLFAKLWPSDVFGQFSFLNSALGFLTLLVLPGMAQVITQTAAEKKEGTYKASIKFLTPWALFVTILLIAGSVYFFVRSNNNLALATLISSLAFPFSTVCSFYNSFLTGKKAFKKVAIFSSIAQLTSIVATSMALIFFPSIYMVTLFSTWSTAITNVLLTLLALKSAENNIIDKKALKFSLHLSFSQTFAIGADYFDRLLIPILLGFSANAAYSFALLIPFQIHSFLKIFISLAQPKIASMSNKNLKRDLIKKCIQLECLIFLIVLIYVFTSPSIFSYLYTPYKSLSVFPSQILSFSLLYFPANLISLVLIKRKAKKEIYKTNITISLFSVLSTLIFTLLFGLMGAIISRVVSRFFQLLLQLYYFRKFFVSKN